MNYRHAFHAGNFADLVKHAALLRLLARLMADASPLTIVDTHAGAGTYDLADPAQARSKEAEAGIGRLQGTGDLPPAMAALSAAVKAANPSGAIRTYPGSPALICAALRAQDRLIACELRADDHRALTRTLAACAARAEARLSDGYAAAVETAKAAKGRLLLLIDPPFERADDYLRLTETVAAVRRAKPDAVILIWAPLKDLETLDSFVRRLEAIPGLSATVSETRLRPLRDPMKLNGCVLVAVDAPKGFAAELDAIAGFAVQTLGEPGGAAKTWHVGGEP
jgi:23S rRNA (adenine2030-N6)-methyltransferase